MCTYLSDFRQGTRTKEEIKGQFLVAVDPRVIARNNDMHDIEAPGGDVVKAINRNVFIVTSRDDLDGGRHVAEVRFPGQTGLQYDPIKPAPRLGGGDLMAWLECNDVRVRIEGDASIDPTRWWGLNSKLELLPL